MVSKKVVIPVPIFIGINSSRNPGFPVKTGIKSLRWFPTGVYPVLDTGSGRRLDSPVSSTGQAYQVRNDNINKPIFKTLQ
jgi:hypothetical protein